MTNIQKGTSAVYDLFIEPKGAHLKGKDQWKNEFLKKLKDECKIITIDSDQYHITGVPFYNKGDENEFKKQIEEMLQV